VGGPNARMLASARVTAVRDMLFGPHAGLPGERWLARPLVAKDMLNWYFPSKYGLQEFRLNEYFAMQADRFKKRADAEWVSELRNLLDEIQSNKEGINNYLSSLSEEQLLANTAAMDLRSILDCLERSPELFDLVQQDEVVAAPSPPPESSPPKDKRHRFVDPLFRRRRLKWMERFMAGMNNAKEIKYNRHFTRHPDEQKQWPTNLGSVTVKWPNRRN
jgi:hypothetical protein